MQSAAKQTPSTRYEGILTGKLILSFSIASATCCVTRRPLVERQTPAARSEQRHGAHVGRLKGTVGFCASDWHVVGGDVYKDADGNGTAWLSDEEGNHVFKTGNSKRAARRAAELFLENSTSCVDPCISELVDCERSGGAAMTDSAYFDLEWEVEHVAAALAAARGGRGAVVVLLRPWTKPLA
jgi:hypothetical protein